MASEPEPTSAAGPPEREHVGGVLGVFVGLLLLIVSVVGLARVSGGPTDGSKRLAEIFVGAPPFGLELAETARLPRGEVIMRLERPAAAADDAPAEGALLPNEVLLVEFPSRAAVGPLFRGEGAGGGPGRDPGHGRMIEEGGGGGANYGASANMLKWEKDPSFAWHTTIERDEIAWGRWRADLKIERSFREGGGWSDAAWVDLSQGERNLVLFARWPDETEVPRDVLRTLLRSISMQEES